MADLALVDDLVQETLALVIDKARRGEIQQPDRLAGFVRSTARNLLIANRRKEARYTTVEDAGVMAGLLRRDGEQRAATPLPQLEQVLQDEEARLVRQHLGELRYDRDRQLLARFYLSEDSKEKLCADLNIDAEHFRRVLFRARQRLRELWDQREKRQWIELRNTG